MEQLFAPPAVYDVARDNNNAGDRVGLAHTLLLVLGIPATFVTWRRNRQLAYVLLVMVTAGLFLLWILTPFADWFWHLGGAVLARLLYRTRLMGVQALAAAAVAGLIVAAVPPRWQRTLGMALSGIFLLIALPTLHVELQHQYARFQLPVDLKQVRATEIATGGSALTAFGEFTPLARTAPFDDAMLTELGADFSAAETPLVLEDVQVRSARVRNQTWDLEIYAAAPTTATLYLLYYPRWEATVDDAPAALAPQEETGYVQLAVPAGNHTVALRYRTTTVEQVGLWVSGLSALVLLLASGYSLRRKQTRKTLKANDAKKFRKFARAETEPEATALPLWLLSALTVLLIFKVSIIDPHTTWFRCQSTPARICGAQVTTDVPFVGAPRLRGFSVASYTLKPGDEVAFELYWQGTEEITKDLWSFVHVRPSADGQPGNPRSEYGIWAQVERVSPGGLLVKDFLPGKLYRDAYRLRLPDDIPPGEYFFEIGWFNPVTGEQADVPPEAIKPPLRILWRSILLPSLHVY